MSENDYDDDYEMSENEEHYRFLSGWGRFNGDIPICKKCGDEISYQHTGPVGFMPEDEYDPDYYIAQCTGCGDEPDFEDPDVDLAPSDDYKLACPDCGNRLHVDKARGDLSDTRYDSSVVVVCPHCWYFGATYSTQYEEFYADRQ
jgi:hypothetical protein